MHQFVGVADLDREWSKASWDRVMDVNLKGPVDLTEKLLPVLAEGSPTGIILKMTLLTDGFKLLTMLIMMPA